ncbi:MAG: four helix bundle protein [Bacteroidia bacterium]|nr:four helix bundle protein [Bacteroidia bacterium]
MKHNFKKLIIWQEAMDLCDKTYTYTENLPSKEKYNLITQMERCVVSIPSNIAEGSGKNTEKHFAEFITTALTSSFELETQLLICQRRSYGSMQVIEELLTSTTNLQSKIYKFREIINGNHKNEKSK